MKFLPTYLKQENRFRAIFDEVPLGTDSMDDRRLLRIRLEAALSPENLTCDGELRGAPLRRKAKLLMGALCDLDQLGA